MNILIIGCGRLGAQLANVLDSQNHDVSVIGSKQDITDNLDENFGGIYIPGSPIDSDVMKNAGVEGCDYVICATKSDNINIMAAQIIKNTFNINNVFVRVLDPLKCKVYGKIGLITISPTSIVFEHIYSNIFNSETDRMVSCGHSSIVVTTISYKNWMKRKTLLDVEYVDSYKLIGFLDEKLTFNMLCKQNMDLKIKKIYKLVYISTLR